MYSKLQKAGGLTALCLMMFIVTLDTTITNIALPNITSYFSTTLDTSNWISTIYVLLLSVFMIPMAKVADQIGRKKVILVGLILFGAGSLACGMANSIGMLVAMRAIQGLSGAIITPIIVPLSVNLFGRERANQIVGIIGAFAAIAAAAGPPIGGLLIHLWSWHEIFFINVPVVIVTLILTIFCFHESYDMTISKSIDYAGIILLSIGLFLITFVLLKGYDFGWLSLRILLMSVGAVLALWLFVYLDLRRKEPLVEFKLFRDRTFLSSTLLYFTCGFTVVMLSVVFNFFLENVRGFSPLHAGNIIMISSIMVIIALPMGSQLGQKLNYRWVNVIGTILMAMGGLVLTQITYAMSNFTMIVDMAIIGLGFGLTSLSLVSAVQYIPIEKAGIASGMINAARQLGTCLGIALLVGILNNNVDNAKSAIKAEAYQHIRVTQVSSSVRHALDKNVENHTRQNSAAIRAAAKDRYRIPVPADSSNLKQVYEGEQKLVLGNVKIANSVNQLYAGTKRIRLVNKSARQLMIGTRDLAAKQKLMGEAVALEAQKHELQTLQNQINRSKHTELTLAFTKTFWIAFLFLTLMCPVAFWTDKWHKSE